MFNNEFKLKKKIFKATGWNVVELGWDEDFVYNQYIVLSKKENNFLKITINFTK